MKKTFAILTVVSLMFISFSCNKTEPGDLDIDAEITKELNTLRIPSVVACIVDKNGIIKKSIKKIMPQLLKTMKVGKTYDMFSPNSQIITLTP